MSEDLTTVADPVKDSLVAVPKATTMVSSMVSVSVESATLIVVFPAIGTSSVLYPMNEKISTPFPGADIVYLPSMSALVPVIVPLTCSEAKGITSPVAESVTIPVTVRFCAKRAELTVIAMTAISNLMYFIRLS